MKKAFLLMVPFLLVMTGCEKEKTAADVTFRKDLSYVRALTTTEMENIYQRMMSEGSKAVSAKVTSQTSSISSFGSTKSTGTATYTANSNVVKSKVTTKTTYKNYGVSYSSNYIATTENWLVEYAGVTKLVSYSMEKQDDLVSEDLAISGEASISTNNIVAKLYSMVANYNLSGYKRKDGYAFVYSQMNKTVTPQQYGSGTKEQIYESYSQVIINVSTKYRLQNASIFTNIKRNRDETTGEWFDGLKDISKSTQYGTVTYGTLSRASDASIKKKLKDNGPIIWNAKAKFSVGYYSSSTLSNVTQVEKQLNYSQSTSASISGSAQYQFSDSGLNCFLRDGTLNVTVLSNGQANTIGVAFELANNSSYLTAYSATYMGSAYVIFYNSGGATITFSINISASLNGSMPYIVGSSISSGYYY